MEILVNSTKKENNSVELKILNAKERNTKGINNVNNKYAYVLNLTINKQIHFLGGCPRGVMVKAMNCGIVVREFVLQSRYYVHFRANTLGKGLWTPLFSLQLWVNSRTD